jgi:hypothetical protein
MQVHAPACYFCIRNAAGLCEGEENYRLLWYPAGKLSGFTHDKPEEVRQGQKHYHALPYIHTQLAWWSPFP